MSFFGMFLRLKVCKFVQNPSLEKYLICYDVAMLLNILLVNSLSVESLDTHRCPAFFKVSLHLTEKNVHFSV